MRRAVVGLGYVGLPVAVALSKKANVIGFDVNQQKIREFRDGTCRDGSIEVHHRGAAPDQKRQCARPAFCPDCGADFKVGYSPERINPGDPVHRFENITKIVSGMDEETLDTVARVYGLAEAGVYRAESIKVAEAA